MVEVNQITNPIQPLKLLQVSHNIETKEGASTPNTAITTDPSSSSTESNEASSTIFSAHQALKVQSPSSIVHKNHLPIESFTLPKERFGVNRVNLAEVLLGVVKKELLEQFPLISFTGSITYALQEDSKTPDWDAIHDIDIRVHTNEELSKEKKITLFRAFIKELKKRGLIIDIPYEREFFSYFWGIRETSGKKYPIQLAIDSINELIDENIRALPYSPFDNFYGTEEGIKLLNDTLSKKGTQGVIDHFKNIYLRMLKNIVSGAEQKAPTTTYKLKLLKRISSLLLMLGKNEEAREVLAKYKEIHCSGDNDEITKTLIKYLPIVQATEPLDKNLQEILDKKKDLPNDSRTCFEYKSENSNTTKAQLQFPEHLVRSFEQRKKALTTDPNIFNEYKELQEVANRLLELSDIDKVKEALRKGQSWTDLFMELAAKARENEEKKKELDEFFKIENLYLEDSISRVANDFAEILPERETEWGIPRMVNYCKIIGLSKDQILAVILSRIYFPNGLNIELFFENAKKWAAIHKQK